MERAFDSPGEFLTDPSEEARGRRGNVKRHWTLALLGVAIASPAGAGVIITVEEVAGDVVFSGGGTLDFSLWKFSHDISTGPQISPTFVIMGATPEADFNVYSDPVNFAGPSEFPTIIETTFADSGIGDAFGIQLNPLSLGVPVGYTSGDPLASTMTFNNHTFASLGLVEGEYTWTWDTLDPRQSDFFTVVVVPAPGAIALLAVAGMAARRRRRG